MNWRLAKAVWWENKGNPTVSTWRLLGICFRCLWLDDEAI